MLFKKQSINQISPRGFEFRLSVKVLNNGNAKSNLHLIYVSGRNPTDAWCQKKCPAVAQSPSAGEMVVLNSPLIPTSTWSGEWPSKEWAPTKTYGNQVLARWCVTSTSKLKISRSHCTGASEGPVAHSKMVSSRQSSHSLPPRLPRAQAHGVLRIQTTLAKPSTKRNMAFPKLQRKDNTPATCAESPLRGSKIL